MTINMTILFIIICCAIVTIIPRILPFIVIRKMKLPQIVIKWLTFIPVCIFTALIVDSIIVQEPSWGLDWITLLAILPTLIIALWTKSLSLTVIVGVASIAIIRIFINMM